MAIDQQIIELLSSGNSRAHKRLVERYGQSIFATIARMVPDLRDAEELTQDTLFTAIVRIRDFDPQQSGFFSWLCHIAYNKAVDFLRRSKPTIVPLETSEAGLADIADEQIEAGLSSGQEERIDRLQQAVEALPPYDRMIISLYYYDSHPLAEIATILNSTPGAIAKRLLRIRQKLYNKVSS
ncbi:MAG: RNA polymerase sigma factor [Bacteroidaceae bacterium]|nr:RNA polymerase sigma factor [Bacteroidaceae bacterium]MBR4783287.1 RNA polymerase sigma factor [Bacteroidaceae bacterium]